MSVTTPTLASATGLVQARHQKVSRWRHSPAIAAQTTWSPDHPMLTIEGRRLLQDKVDALRTVVLPVLHVASTDPHCDVHTEAVYVRALGELRRLGAVLAEADEISTHKDAPSLVELGDLVTVEFLDTGAGPAANGADRSGPVERFLLVHPAERCPDGLRLSAASPLARAVLGRTIGNVLHVAAPAGLYPVRILAAKRPRGSATKVVPSSAPHTELDEEILSSVPG